MASVIADICEHKSDTLTCQSYATWRPSSPLWSAVRCLKLIIALSARRMSADVVHVHLSEGGSFIREGLAVSLACMLRRIPVVATLHGANFAQFTQRHPRLARFTLGLCAGIVCLGPESAKLAEELAPRAKVVILLNPVRLHTTPGGRACPPHVLFAGEVGQRKGIDRLLSAWPDVLKLEQRAQLLVCGPMAKDFGDLGERAGVHYLGKLDRAHVLSLYNSVAVTCLPSRLEVLPMTVLESLAAGVPVVCSDAGEMAFFHDCPAATVIQQNGTTEDEFIAALTRAVVQRLQERHSINRSAVQDWITTRASLSTVIAQLEGLYLRVREANQ
ncbi:glycosyltransferase family 4 protein [Actinomycetospora corticicola]